MSSTVKIVILSPEAEGFEVILCRMGIDVLWLTIQWRGDCLKLPLSGTSVEVGLHVV